MVLLMKMWHHFGFTFIHSLMLLPVVGVENMRLINGNLQIICLQQMVGPPREEQM